MLPTVASIFTVATWKSLHLRFAADRGVLLEAARQRERAGLRQATPISLAGPVTRLMGAGAAPKVQPGPVNKAFSGGEGCKKENSAA